MAIYDNKVQCVRAGVCRDLDDAASCREHNGTNVLVFAADRIKAATAKTIVQVWFQTKFDPESRHARRVRQITGFEKDMCSSKAE